jgi:hypothetical protein
MTLMNEGNLRDARQNVSSTSTTYLKAITNKGQKLAKKLMENIKMLSLLRRVYFKVASFCA